MSKGEELLVRGGARNKREELEIRIKAGEMTSMMNVFKDGDKCA